MLNLLAYTLIRKLGTTHNFTGDGLKYFQLIQFITVQLLSNSYNSDFKQLIYLVFCEFSRLNKIRGVSHRVYSFMR